MLERTILVVIICKTHDMQGNGGKSLLETGLSFLRNADCTIVKAHNIIVDAHIEDRFAFRDEAFRHQRISHLSLKTNPEFFPTAIRIRTVSMPFSWKKHQQIPLAHTHAMSNGTACKATSASGNVDQLIFIQDPALVCGKNISGRMVLRRIGHPWSDILKANRIHSKPPK